MKVNKTAVAIVAVLVAVAGYFGVSKEELVSVLNGPQQQAIECKECPECPVCPECEKCPEPIVCPECPECKKCEECPECPECPPADLAPKYDSTFTGRIVYEDKSPYKRGVVRAVGENWISYALTDDKGKFTLSVKGGSPFTFSAYSPFGDARFYDYGKSIMVPEDTDGNELYCTDGSKKLEICTASPAGSIISSEWGIGYKNTGASVDISDGRIVISKGAKYSYAKKPYKYKVGKTYHFKIDVHTEPKGKKWCVAAQSQHGYCSTEDGLVEFDLKAKDGDSYIGLFGYGEYDVVYTKVIVEEK